MNIPSFSALLDRTKLFRTVQDVCEQVNQCEKKTNIEFEAGKNALEVNSEGGMYIYGVGGYDGTNAGEEGVKTLQEVLGE